MKYYPSKNFAIQLAIYMSDYTPQNISITF